MYDGPNKFVEYIEGNSPIIISAPHGGVEKPSSIPDKPRGSQLSDLNTRTLAKRIVSEIERLRPGFTPHFVMAHIHRSKVDMNRSRDDSDQAVDKKALEIWDAYHRFMNTAKAVVTTDFGKGIIFDIHGVATHKQKWIELGYNIKADTLNKTDIELNDVHEKGSVSNLTNTWASDKVSFSDIIRGKSSFGALLKNYKVVPSPSIPCPKKNAYYTGGYITREHGSIKGGVIDAIQIESPSHLRKLNKIPDYATELAKAILYYHDNWYLNK